jgi:hypothetical protein
MTRFEPMTATTASIRWPACPRCGTAMIPVLTEPYTPGYFECPTCDRSDGAVVRFT